MDGYNYNSNGYVNPAGPAQDLQGYQHQPVRCPGKEIVGFVFGINALVWGILGTMFSWIPFYGMIFSVIWGGMGIVCGIVALTMHKQVHEVAEEISNKIENGKKMAIPGIIVGAVGIVISILVFVLMIVVVGASAFASFSQYKP